MALESFSSGFSSIRVKSLVFLRKSAVFRSFGYSIHSDFRFALVSRLRVLGWGQFGPVYKAPRFQSSPGKMCVLNFDWLRGWEAVTGERR